MTNPKELKAEFQNKLKSLCEGGKRRAWEVFQDFVELAYCAIAKRTTVGDTERQDALEARYMKCVGKYSKEQAMTFASMLGCLQMFMSTTFEDFLGSIYEDSGFTNERNGQFFTPWELCQMMSRTTFGDVKQRNEPVLTVADPCCGSGRLLLSSAEFLKDSGREHTTGMWVSASDLDIVCFQMTFLQLSLSGIPGVVHWENTITRERHESAITPMGVILYNDSEYLRNWLRGGQELSVHEILSQFPQTKHGDKLWINIGEVDRVE